MHSSFNYLVNLIIVAASLLEVKKPCSDGHDGRRGIDIIISNHGWSLNNSNIQNKNIDCIICIGKMLVLAKNYLPKPLLFSVGI